MEDLKENTQKKIMEKLVLSAALGMFCYCSNNVTKGMESNLEESTTNNIKNEQGEEISIKEETIPALEQKGPEDNKQTIENLNEDSKIPSKEKEKDEECCPCCCCCEETKPVEKDQQSRKSENIILEEEKKETQMSKIEEDKEGENETSE